MNSPRRIAIPAVTAALIAASGALHAVQTGAWGREKLLATSASRLEHVPLELGDWNGRPLELDPEQLKVAQASGAISRSYTDGDRTAVNVMLLCGPSGPIAVHPPTVCFVAAGYTQATEQRRVDVLDSDGRRMGSFWTADFEWPREDGTSNRVRTYWGWSTDGHWKSPDYPRYEFAGSQVLYKLYVTRQVTDEPVESEPIDTFLRSFLPEVNETLFQTSG